MRRRRELTEAELLLWRRALSGTEPMPGRTAPPPLSEIEPRTVPVERPPRVAARAPRRAVPLDPHRPVDLDRRTWLRLKRGQVAIEATLDLHGLTQDEAHRRLERFLAGAQAQGRRCVLVVTGKGGAGGGVLRQMVPRWLNEGGNRERVLAYCAAQPPHGGAGALYVLVRRRRQPGR